MEPTNEWYAIAKIAGIKLAQAYRKQYGFRAIGLMPTNLYGPRRQLRLNHFARLAGADPQVSRGEDIGKTKEVTVWGTGSPRREFLHVADLADAAVFLMESYDDPQIINVGTGQDLSIRELAEMVAEIVGYDGRLVFDASKPDGNAAQAAGRGVPDLRSGGRRTSPWRTGPEHLQVVLLYLLAEAVDAGKVWIEHRTS